MNPTLLGLSVLLLAAGAVAQPQSFAQDTIGAAPTGWSCGVTGRGSPHWAVTAEADGSKVLTQSGKGDFPWCVKSGTALADGVVEVKFKSISGREDQAGGVVWRWKDGDNYYVARANAQENNVSLYYTERGNRKTIKYVNAPVAPNTWHTLKVEFLGARISVSLDGKRYIDVEDNRLAGAGSVGVWTKADSVTSFKDFSFGAVR